MASTSLAEAPVGSSESEGLVRLLFRQQQLFLAGERRPVLARRASEIESYLSARLRSSLINGENRRPGAGLFVVVTRRCQMRCDYCTIDDYSGDMEEDVLYNGLERVIRAEPPSLRVHFFGGEPLQRFNLIEKGVEWMERRRPRDAGLNFAVTTNGLLIDRAKLDFFAAHRFHVEVSCDGRAASQLAHRKLGSADYFERLAWNMEQLRTNGISYHVVMTVVPEESPKLYENFRWLADQGHRRIQITSALGRFWSDRQSSELLDGLGGVSRYVAGRPHVELMNRGVCPEPMILNAQPMMDFDGGFYLQLALFFNRGRSLRLNRLRNGAVDARPPSQLETFWRLAHCFSESSRQREFSRLVLNNIRLGWLVGEKTRGESHV